MRTVKFRGKRLANGEWIYGSLCQGATRSAILVIRGDKVTFDSKEVFHDTVGQSTLINDEDGVEIYEGDILENDVGVRMLVAWNQEVGAFCLKAFGQLGIKPVGEMLEWYRMKIIGNIYDDPELLDWKTNE